MVIKPSFFWFKIIRKVLLGLILGISFCIFYFGNSQTLKQHIQQYIHDQVHQALGVECDLTIDSINWLTLHINCSGVDFHPDSSEQKKWAILAESMQISASWLNILLTRHCNISLKFDQMVLYENFENKPESLSAFFAQLFTISPDSFIGYDVVSMNNSLLLLNKTNDDLTLKIPFACNLRGEKDYTRLRFFLNNGSISHHGLDMVKNIAGSIIFDIAYKNPLENLSGSVDVNYQVVKNNQKIPSFLNGKIDRGTGSFQLKIEDGSLVIDPITIACSSNHCWCQAQVAMSSDCLSYMQIPELLHDLVGKLKLSLRCDLFDIWSTMQIALLFNDLGYQSYSLLSGARLNVVNSNKDGFLGICSIHEQDVFQVTANYQDQIVDITNVSRLSVPFFPDYHVDVNRCTMHVDYKNRDHIVGSYECHILHNKGKNVVIKGTFDISKEKFIISGWYNDVSFDLRCGFIPEFSFESFCVERNGVLLIDLSGGSKFSDGINGSIDFSVIKDLVHQDLKNSFSQEGSVVIRGKMNQGVFEAQIQSHYAHIRIPYVYNVIQNFTAAFFINFAEKTITARNIELDLYEGKINCSQAKILYNSKGAIEFLHAPLMLHDVMLSWNKSLYGVVSGSMLLSKLNQQSPMRLLGQLMIEKSEIKENIFSLQGQNILSSHPERSSYIFPKGFEVDISCFTKNPLTVDTSFLNVAAKVGVQVKGSAEKLNFSGSIDLASGTLQFPYKPLHIVSGKLVFIPEQSFDPVIDFVAKGKIRQYLITLKAWGTVLDPHIQFEAEPYLSENQIISLLLLGVCDQSLSFMVPAFLMQRLKDLIFGPAISHHGLKSFFDVLLESLKYVRFTPQFSNKTGRGGMRGIFEVDATEHLQGKIDTNFVHLEDTKFDIDYAATDDITLRLQKDGPSTYGGQVELKWKFS